MVSKLCTEVLVMLAVGLGIAWFCVWLHEHDVCPLRSLKKTVRKLSIVGICALALWAMPFIQYGSTKGGNGGTNIVQMVVGPGAGVLPLVGDPPVVDEWEDFTPITSTNTTRTLDGDDFRRGFVLARVGTDEVRDFSPPPEATVCVDWRAFGAAEDWFYVTFTNWAFQVNTNEVNRLRIHSDGWVGMLGMPVPLAFWPLKTKLETAPGANWHLITDATGGTPVVPGEGQEASCPSRFWHFVTPSNTLQVAWQNILLDGDTNTPVSVQAEFWTDGQFTFRYDLSRCGALGERALPEGCGLGETGAITNVLVGAQLGGLEWTTNAIPTNVTSLVFWPISPEDAYDPDADGDGLPTIDELFVYGTDPHRADTDRDRLSDYEELFVYHTDPLDSYSVGACYCDGIAVKIGDEDPFSCPEGSTNTVLEHVFYSGTTNGAFAYPQSSDGMAVLRVSVSGSGTGDLVVGEQAVPLVAPPQMRSGPTVSPLTLLVQVVKGETYRLYRRGSEELNVALDSDDFAFGSLPSYAPVGYVNFPNTVATPPCIHDFNARRRRVSLPLSRDADAMTCTWNAGMSMDVTVSNIPPCAATITGNFSARSTSGITYELDHPNYLFGRKNYDQTVRFCPHPSEPDPDDPDPEPDPPWFESGEGGDSESNEGEDPGRWCCHWGLCEWYCACGCGGNHGGEGGPDDEEDFDDNCPVHSCPYEECAHLHASDYTNALVNVEHLGGVLYIRDPPQYEQIVLEVPTQHHRCCPCPDHSTNYVGVAYKSSRLRLLDANGLAFRRSGTSCTVNLAGVYPSSEVGDATLAFVRNGEVYQQQNRTVLGVSIKGSAVDLAACNALNANFGYPMTVSTNLTHTTAPDMKLVTNVRLPGGNVHLELVDATAPFTVWYYEHRAYAYRKLLDTATTPVKDLSMAYWKVLMRRAVRDDGQPNEMPIYITSPTPGTVKLLFRYWTVIDGQFVQDTAVQQITSVLPPLRLDITRDGSIDEDDSAGWHLGRTFYYWINEDNFSGDWINQGPNLIPNTWDFTVNGTFDLVNFFPVALDLSAFTAAWQGRVTYTVKPRWGRENTFNFCFADVPWSRAGTIQTTNVTTTAGQTLSSASLAVLPSEGYALPYAFLTSFSADSGLMICEAKSEYASLQIDIKSGDTVLYRYYAPMTILPVKQMYSWYNFRHYSGQGRKRNSSQHILSEEHNTKSLIFLHGANVNEDEAEVWGDVLFKRLWLSGMQANFYNVDWRSDIGNPANYQENASNAFVVASQIADTINGIPGEKIIMAHSLGNMVVSSMIQDHGLQVSKYLMCNSAVPAEAYDTTLGPTNLLVHPKWEAYPRGAFANEWYKLFLDDATDDRRKLTWKGRFSSVVQYAVNFYSSKDHVLELFPTNVIGLTDGYENWEQKYERYSWHSQELWKGRKKGLALMGTTDWSGWGFREDFWGDSLIPPTNAWLMSEAELKTNTVFRLQPESMNTNVISRLVLDMHLTQGIPARTPATGFVAWGDDDMSDSMFDLNNPNTQTRGIARPNGWPIRTFGWLITTTWETEWLHSDMKDVSYFFNHKFFEKVIEEGNLR